jgi:putative transposase
MPRPRRLTPAGTVFHVINRRNDRHQLFFETADYLAFQHLLEASRRRYPIRIYAHHEMPNHFHLMLEPLEDRAVSAALHWIETRSSCHFREVTGTRGDGHVFQRRFWCRAIRSDGEYLTVMKYIEGNALRAGLVKRAEDWRWGSLWERVSHAPRVIDPSRVPLPPDWPLIVNAGCTETELTDIRNRRRPGGAMR